MSGSPFPGMDPYLEEAHRWESVHTLLTASATALLNRALPSPYVAVAEEWLRVLPGRERVRPDISIDFDPKPVRSSGSTAVLERAAVPADEPVIVASVEDEPRQRYINIVRGLDEGEIVATIEYLSHSNKAPGNDRDA